MQKQIISLLTFYMIGVLTLRTEDNLELLNTSTKENLCYEFCCKAQDVKTLKECFKTLSHEDRIKLFDEISSEHKEKFLEELNFFEYEEFLDDFSEYDWKRILKKTPQDKKSLWTKKIKKQRIIINKTYHEVLKKLPKSKDH